MHEDACDLLEYLGGCFFIAAVRWKSIINEIFIWN